jgi:hypothetical protein
MAETRKDCEEAKFYAPANQVGGVKLNKSCSTETLKIPAELREPQGEQPSETPLLSPRPIIVSNLQVTVTCDELYYNTEGPPVTVAAKEFTALISLNTIAGVADSVLDYIARQHLEDEIEAQLESRTLTTEALIALTGLTTTQATTFLRLAEAQQSTLDLSARTLALGRLKCLWWNTEQEAECPDPLMATTNEFALAQYRVVVARHTVSSAISQEEANSQAKSQAEAQLNCLYISDAFTAKCTTRDTRPYPITEHVPNDETPVTASLPKRVGTFSVPAGAFISFDSKEDADAQAEAYAWSQLECFYVNDLVERRCEDPRARNRGVDPNIYPAVEADIVNRVAGQHVVIPVGFFTSDLSTADATQQAIALADMLIECCFLSEPVTITCPPDEDGNPASAKGSTVYSISVPRGAFVSCVSQEEANASAIASIQAELQCAYCNDTVTPTCVPDWVVEAATTGVRLTQDLLIQGEQWFKGELYKLKLPFSPEGLVNPYTGLPESISDWSDDATSGIESDAICSEKKKQEAQDIAETIAQIKLKAPKEDNEGENCHYTNTKVLIGCSFIDPYRHSEDCELKHLTQDSEHQLQAYGSSTFKRYNSANPVARDGLNNDPEAPIEYRRTKAGEPYVVVQLAKGTCHSVNVSKPSDFGYIEIEAGTIIMTPAEVPWLDTEGLTPDEMKAATMDYMEQLIIAMFLPTIQCHYTNPPMAIACSWTKKISTGCATDYITVNDGDNYSITAEKIEAWNKQDLAIKEFEPGLQSQFFMKADLWPDKEDKVQQRRYIAKAMSKQYLPWEPTSCELPAVTEFADPEAIHWWYGASKPAAWDTRLVEGAPTRDVPIMIAQGTFSGPDYTVVLHETLALAYSLIQGRCKYYNKEVRASRRCACSGIHTKRTHLISGSSWEVSIVVPEGVVQADSPAEADAIAREMADIEARGKCPCLYGNEPLYCDCWAYLKTLSWSGKGKWETPPTPEMLEDMKDKQFYLPADTFVSEDPWEIEALLDEQIAENCATLICKLHAQWMWWSSGKVKCKCCCDNWLTTEPTFCGPRVIDEKTGKCIELTFNKGAYTGSQKKMPLRVQEACIEQCMLLTYIARTVKVPCASFQVVANMKSGGAGYCYDITDGKVRLPGGRTIKIMYYQNFLCTSEGPFEGEITLQFKKTKSGDYNVYYVAINKDGTQRKKELVYPYPV